MYVMYLNIFLSICNDKYFQCEHWTRYIQYSRHYYSQYHVFREVFEYKFCAKHKSTLYFFRSQSPVDSNPTWPVRDQEQDDFTCHGRNAYSVLNYKLLLRISIWKPITIFGPIRDSNPDPQRPQSCMRPLEHRDN